MRKINEIFYSLQGEGFHTGTPAVFVRFSGCNLRCSFCDTRHEEGVMMTDEEIVEKVSSFPARMVILTGGEPSLWIDKALISRLREAGKQICIETNGTRPLPDGIDWVTCSPKENAPSGIGKSRRDKGGLYRARPVRIRRNPRTVPFPATLLLPKYERGSGLHPPASPVEAKPANP